MGYRVKVIGVCGIECSPSTLRLSVPQSFPPSLSLSFLLSSPLSDSLEPIESQDSRGGVAAGSLVLGQPSILAAIVTEFPFSMCPGHQPLLLTVPHSQESQLGYCRVDGAHLLQHL